MLEMIMIIVVIAILAVLAIPRFDTYYDLKLNGAARKLISDIRYVQQISISKHTGYGLEFDTGGNSYRVFLVSSDATIPDPTTRTNMIIDYDTSAEFAGIDLNAVNFGGTAELRFSSLGEPRDANNTALAASGTVTLVYQGRTKTVTVTPETGRATCN
ncbi:MAG: GspH/FimT family protein [Candidatus Omnitrophica bacterium]|nr:GspH/FimT family protein [Candidatus Omnitrophota bacterium]